MKPIMREAIVERRQVPMRWSAVFAGAVVSLACWLLLQLIGSGIAMQSFSMHDLTGLAVVTGGWWWIVAAAIATFVGGLVAGWLETSIPSRGMGAIYGLVSWGLAAVAAMTLVLLVVFGIAGSAIRISSAAIEGNATATAAAAAFDPAAVPAQDQQLVAVVQAAGYDLLWIGITLVITLITAMIGGALGVRTRGEPAAPAGPVVPAADEPAAVAP